MKTRNNTGIKRRYFEEYKRLSQTLDSVIGPFKSRAKKIFEAIKDGDKSILTDLQLLLKRKDLDSTHVKLKDAYNAIAVQEGFENWQVFKLEKIAKAGHLETVKMHSALKKLKKIKTPY